MCFSYSVKNMFWKTVTLLSLLVLVCDVIQGHKQNVNTKYVTKRTFEKSLNTTNSTQRNVTEENAQVSLSGDNRIQKCKYEMDPSLLRNNITLRDECCNDLYHIFRIYWNHSTIKLSDLLRALKTWQCPQFAEECSKRHYAFSEYTKLVYDRFCSPAEFSMKCACDVRRVLKPGLGIKQYVFDDEGSGSADFENSSRYEVIEIDDVHCDHLKDELDMEDQLNSCVQAALVNVQTVTAGKYYEVKQGEIAFCDISWCAFRTDTFETNHITDASCMPLKCKINVYVMMGTVGLIGVLIILANLTVLIVFGTNRRLMNSQGIYKMSLAAADLLCGLFVFPILIETMRRSMSSRYEVIDSEVVEYSWGSGRNGTRLTLFNFDQGFYSFAGFFTTLSLAVSMYTLVIASFDRLLVVYRPLQYNQFRARTVAKRCVTVLWILGIIYSALPIVVEDLEYMRVASILVSLGGGEVAIILYIITFAIPLLLVWALNLATFSFSRRNAQVRPKLRFNGTTVLSVNLENQLAKTLSIMVGVFTLCIIPVGVVLVSELFLKGIHYEQPWNFHMPTAVLVISLEAVSALILMSNSLWNFFIYNVRSKEFRACFLSLCRTTKNSCCRSRGVSTRRNSAYTTRNISSTNGNGSNGGKNLTMSTRVRTSGNTG